MSFKSKRLTAIAILLLLATGGVHLGVSFAEPDSGVPSEGDIMAGRQIPGILTTQRNNEITVNGTSSISGATIFSGASIETPAGMSATVSLGSRGSLEIEPKTKMTLKFDQGGVKILLTEGCVNLRTKKGTSGEINTAQGSIGKTDPAGDGKLQTCPRSAAPIVPACHRAGGLFCLGVAAAVAIIAEGNTAVAVPVAPRGILY